MAEKKDYADDDILYRAAGIPRPPSREQLFASVGCAVCEVRKTSTIYQIGNWLFCEDCHTFRKMIMERVFAEVRVLPEKDLVDLLSALLAKKEG